MTRLQEPFTFVQAVLKIFVSKKLFVLTITGIIFFAKVELCTQSKWLRIMEVVKWAGERLPWNVIYKSFRCFGQLFSSQYKPIVIIAAAYTYYLFQVAN